MAEIEYDIQYNICALLLVYNPLRSCVGYLTRSLLYLQKKQVLHGVRHVDTVAQRGPTKNVTLEKVFHAFSDGGERCICNLAARCHYCTFKL